ncbi:hypothetical protein RIF29_07478 [Crotalaria pallida]|uniref:peroxidase n=1 Tax=Crotalaria pallida TaxID=3830 RepID=A0AAN9J6Z2_CROPI
MDVMSCFIFSVISTDQMILQYVSLPPFQHSDLNCSSLVTGAHTHCSQFSKRIYNFRSMNRIFPTLNLDYAKQIQKECPKDVDPRMVIDIDSFTNAAFDNQYYKNLQQGKGLFSSDQSFFTDRRTRNIVNLFASNSTAFEKSFVIAITKLGRVGIKTTKQGEIRHECSKVN